MRLEGKTAIITGGSRGIGYAVAEAFVKEGAKVAVCGSKLETAQQAVDRLKAAYPGASLLPLGVRVTEEKEVEQMAEAVAGRWGRIDILVNNAGVTSAKSVFETTLQDFQSVIDINLTGTFLCIRAVGRKMREQRCGSIINTSSMVGSYGGNRQSAYASSKFGVNGLTKSCAKELGEFRIRVNAVAPGVVGTDMVAQSVTDQMKQAMERMTPLRKIAEPSELAGAYVYLASEESSFTTGAILAVDGGMVL